MSSEPGTRVAFFARHDCTGRAVRLIYPKVNLNDGDYPMSAVRPTGVEIQLPAQISGDQAEVRVTTLANGNYVVVWTETNSVGTASAALQIFGQIFAANGTTVDDPFQVNTTDLGVNPRITALADGGFVVFYSSLERAQPYDIVGTSGQIFDASGQGVGGPITVQSDIIDDGDVDDSFAISATGLEGGGTVLTWISFSSSGHSFNTSVYDASGTLVTNIQTLEGDSAFDGVVAALSGGGFVLAESTSIDGDVQFSIYDASGQLQSGPTLANATTAGAQTIGSVDIFADGSFLLTWTSAGQDGSGNGGYGQRFTEAGLPIGVEFQINTTTLGSQFNPQVTVLSDGGFVIVWESWGQDGDAGGIYGQRYSSDGSTIGDEFLVNTITAGNQNDMEITALDNGGFVVTWVLNGDYDSGEGVFARHYSGQLFGSAAADNIADTSGANWLHGRGGNDTLYGFGGDDLIHGGHGDDTLYGGEGSDRLKGNKGNDTLYGEAGNDFLKGQAGDDTLIGGTGKDTLRGGTGADTFVFNQISDSTLTENDRIMDFEVGIDYIDLSAVASSGFSFIDGVSFSGTGAEVRAVQNGGNTILRIDVDGDGVADMKIFLAGTPTLTVDDFIF